MASVGGAAVASDVGELGLAQNGFIQIFDGRLRDECLTVSIIRFMNWFACRNNEPYKRRTIDNCEVLNAI